MERCYVNQAWEWFCGYAEHLLRFMLLEYQINWLCEGSKAISLCTAFEWLSLNDRIMSQAL
jgi:hypothetical protein